VAHPWQLVFGASLAENLHVSLAGLCRSSGKSRLLYATLACEVTPCWLTRIGFEKVTMAGYGNLLQIYRAARPVVNMLHIR